MNTGKNMDPFGTPVIKLTLGDARVKTPLQLHVTTTACDIKIVCIFHTIVLRKFV
jgi:hypothetical protein